MAEPYLYTVAEERGPLKELWIKATPAAGSTWSELYSKIQDALQHHKAQIISQQVFIPIGEEDAESQAFKQTFSPCDWPATKIISQDTSQLGGAQIWAATGSKIKFVDAKGRITGNFFSDEVGQYCRLEGVTPSGKKQSPAAQAREVFTQIDDLLQQAGMDFSHVVRTWFFLDHILAWYGDFNNVRNEFFKKKGVGKLPASTGIGGANPQGSAIIAGALAFKPNNSEAKIQLIDSSLQCPATSYNSAFSRALLLNTSHYKKLWISGTAAIDQQGLTIYQNDLSGQVNHTVQAVHSLLEEQNMEWFNVVQATAYFKNASDTSVIRKPQFKRAFQFMPLVVSCNTICRNDLLFELAAEAYCER
jgi:enamine deaminase RidA (YjgF/YER057c/UK114 family)